MNSKMNHVTDWSLMAKDAEWSVGEIAKRCGVSSQTLRRYFIMQFGQHPREWIAGQRQLQAVTMLKGGFSVKEVATRLEYTCPETFSREFKRYWGKSPTEMLLEHSHPEKCPIRP